MRTTATFMQPYFGDDVDVYIDSTEFAVEGQTVLVPGGGYYLIDTIVDDKRLTLMNMGFQQNAPYGTPVLRSTVVSSGTPQMSSVNIPNGTGTFDVPYNNVSIILGAISGSVTINFVFGGALNPMLGTRVIIADIGWNLGISTPMNFGSVVNLSGVGPITSYTTQYGILDLTYVDNYGAGNWVATS